MSIQLRPFSTEQEQPTNALFRKMAGVLDPNKRSPYDKYREDWAGFIQDEMGVGLTDGVHSVVKSVERYQVTVVRSATGVGKTHGGAHLAGAFFSIYPKSQIYTCAAPPESNLKLLLWGEIDAMVERNPQIFRNYRTLTGHIDRGLGSRSWLTSLTIPTTGTPAQREARFSGKHAPQLLFMVDEGDAVPPEVYKGIDGCMSGGLARLVIFFNPRSKDCEPAVMEAEGRANVIVLSAFDHPNVRTGLNKIPGAVTREKTVQRINEWCRPRNKSEANDESVEIRSFRLPAFLEGETAQSERGVNYPPLQKGYYVVESDSFFYKVLALYPPEDQRRLISDEWIERAQDRHRTWVMQNGDRPPELVEPIMGLDIADFGDDPNMMCLRWGGYLRFESWNGVDVNTTSRRAAELYKQAGCKRGNVDTIGIGAGVPENMMERGCRGVAGVRVSKGSVKMPGKPSFFKLRDEIYWLVREWLRTDPTAMLPDLPELIQELRAPAYREENGSIRVTPKEKLRQKLGRSPNYFESLALTLSQQKADFGSI